MKRILALALVVLLVAALFTGCAAKPEGTYKIETIDGKNVKDYFKEAFELDDDTIDSALELLGVESFDEIMKITMKSDGNFTIDYMGQEMAGTWKLDGEKLTLTNEDGEDQEATFKGGKIIIDMDGEEMVLGK